jgi:hypothetical protein
MPTGVSSYFPFIDRPFQLTTETGRALRDHTQDLRGALAPAVTTHHAVITEPRRVGEFLRALHSYRGLPVTEAALKVAPLVFVHPGELRKAEWLSSTSTVQSGAFRRSE